MKKFYVYILKCNDESYYVGHTDELEKRINEHVRGKSSCYTKNRLPVYLVYNEAFASRYEAICAERKLKKWNRAKKEAYMVGDWELLSKLSKRKKKINLTPTGEPFETQTKFAPQGERSLPRIRS